MWQELDGSARRRLAVLLGLGLLYGSVLGSQFYIARLVHGLGGSATVAGLLLVLSLVPVFAVAVCGERIARRWSPRQMLRAGLACHAAQMLLMATASHLGWLVPAMLLSGFGYALCFGPLLNSATNSAPKAHYAQSIAYLSLSVQMGVGLNSVMTAIVEPLLGTAGTFWIPAGLAIVGIGIARHLPLAPPAASLAPAGAVRPSARGGLVQVFILMAILGLTFGVPLQFVPMWLGSDPAMNFSPAFFLTTSFFTIMATRLLFGHLLSGERELRVVVTCFTVVSLAIAVLGLAHTPWQFALCAVFYGAAYSLLYPSCTAYLIQQVESEQRGVRSNWVLLGYEIGTRCLPALFGAVADLGGFPLTFCLLAVLIGGTGAWHIHLRLQGRHAGSAVAGTV